ncbi:MAG: serine/threonine-protein phosphatase [Lachnospiraceae bacterium]|nr:serine/threonine-protein phosphatase [Lachnospiraceae bacterium]
MKYKIVAHTDIGIQKSRNQDAVLLKVAQTDYGDIALGAICDGMGGLSKGELASSTVIRMVSQWFDHSFPELLYRGLSMETLRASWNHLTFQANSKLYSCGQQTKSKMGTTMALLLIAGKTYYLCNVGDSRVYCVKEKLTLLTKDQTLVQREIDFGRLSYDEARKDSRRNILLQCIGASSVVKPDYYTGTVESECIFLLCSDGFRHVVTEKELYQSLTPYRLNNELSMKKSLLYLTELNKSRFETDNISAALVRVD